MYYYSWSVRDYLAKTRHLSLIEDLAYRRCLDTYYTEEGPLPSDPKRVARLIAMPDHVEEVTAILNEFFTLTDAGWANARADEEIGKFKEFAEAGRRGAAKRWAKAGQTPADGEANGPANGEANSPPNPTPIATNNHKPITKEPKVLLGFAEFWSAYPRKVSKAEALKAWGKVPREDGIVERIMAALATAKQSRDWTKDDGQFIPHASTWLNQRRWEDEVGAGGGESEDHFKGLI